MNTSIKGMQFANPTEAFENIYNIITMKNVIIALLVASSASALRFIDNTLDLWTEIESSNALAQLEHAKTDI